MSTKSPSSAYIEQLVIDVKKKLPEYLSLHGIVPDKSGVFHCINPNGHKNNDKTPSASISQASDGIYLWNCFSCKKGGTIYDAAAILDGYGCDGPEFIPTTIALAEKLGINVDQSKVPASNPKLRLITDIYKEIAKFIITTGNGVECLCSGKFGRHYDLTEAEEILKIVPFAELDNDALNTYIQSKFTDTQLSDIPFYNKNTKRMDSELFGAGRMSFPLYNSYGNPVGFCSRMSDAQVQELKSQGKSVMKYKNSVGTGSYKRKSPFLFNEAQKYIPVEKRVIFVEGQFDALSLFIKGYKNVVPLMGSSLNIELMTTINRRGIYEVIFALDGDKAGIVGLKKSLQELGSFNLTTTVMKLPTGKDPDNIVMEDPALFETIYRERKDAIEFILENDPDLNDPNVPGDVRYTNLIQYVCDRTSIHAKLREYSKVIARVTGESEIDTFEDMKSYSRSQETRNSEVDKAWAHLQESRYRPFEEKLEAITEVQETIKRVSSKREEHLLQRSWSDLRSLASGETKLPTRLYTGIKQIDEYVSIECGTFNIIGGWASNGKSSVMRSLMVDMIERNPDTIFLYVSTDDHPTKTLIDTVALMTNLPKESIKSSLNDSTFTEKPEIRQHLDKLQTLLSSRVIILGQEDAGSVAQIRKKTDVICAQCPGMNVCVIVDAINNLTDVTNPKKGDQRIGLEYVTRELKNMAAATDNVACISLLHLNKTEWRKGMRPTLGKIKGSGFMEYEAKVVIFAYMDQHYDRETKLVWRSPFGKMAPVIEFLIAKDKDKEANVLVPLHFEPIVGKITAPQQHDYDRYMKLVQSKYNQDSDSGSQSSMDGF